MDSGKKISFGFTKSIKKSTLIPTSHSTEKTENTSVEYVKCLEGQEVKLVVEKAKQGPLVVPLREDGKSSNALASLRKRKAVLLGEEEGEDEEKKKDDSLKNTSQSGGDSLEQKAVKELLAAAEALKQGREYGDGSSMTSGDTQLVLPVAKGANELPLDGAKESTIDDYESIPIQEFGKAMLRGMGWDEKETAAAPSLPPLRPKGMGLGADKAVRAKPLLIPAEANEILTIKKNACVRILAGKHKDLYGRVQGMDDYASRVIVQMAIGGNVETFNEFLCQPVSQKEYTEYGKCLNTAKYKEYKENETKYELKKHRQKTEEEKSQRRSSSNHEKEDRKYQMNENLSKKTNKTNDFYDELHLKTQHRIKEEKYSSRELELENRNYSRKKEQQSINKDHHHHRTDYDRYKNERKIKREKRDSTERESSSRDNREKKMAQRYESNVVESDLSSSSHHHQHQHQQQQHHQHNRKDTIRVIESSEMLSDDELSRMSSSTDRRKKKKKKEKKHRGDVRRTEDSDSNYGKSRSSSKPTPAPPYSSRSPSMRRRSTSVVTSSSDDDSSSEFARHIRQKRERKQSKQHSVRRL